MGQKVPFADDPALSTVTAGAADRFDRQVVLAACPLCGRGDAGAIAVHPRVTFVRCRCGLAYRESHVVGGPDGEAALEPLSSPARERYRSRQRRRIRKSRYQILDLLNHVERGPLLDIGCSLGPTLRAARSLGIEATGIDISEPAVRDCGAAGLRAARGCLDRLPFVDAAFQLVTMKHVLEHTPHPRAALREVRRVLRRGGGLFVAVPHGDFFRAVLCPQQCKFFAKHQRGGHYVYYTPDTLQRLLADEGFRVVRTHPHLWHRSAPAIVQARQALLAPARYALEATLTTLRLRKEFWLCAVRD